MYLSKKHIDRRAVLQGIGATIGLPLLEAMIPASTAMAQTPAGKVPKRFAVARQHPAINATASARRRTPRDQPSKIEV